MKYTFRTLAPAVIALALLAGVGAAALPARQAAAASSTPCVKRVLRKGANNVCVGYLQTMLNGVGASPALAVDNDFGPKTKTAVTQWQFQQWKLDSKIKIDSIVGKQTWTTLCAQKAKFVQTATQAGCDKLTATASTTPAKKHTGCAARTFSTYQNKRDTKCVGLIQTLLSLNDPIALTPDGVFGPNTKAAVKNWQTKMNLRRDGIVGRNTWNALCSQTKADASDNNLYSKLAIEAGCQR